MQPTPPTPPLTGQREEPSTPPMYASILAGGSGTRLWPLSAQDHPKQFLPLPGPRTMLQETIARIAPLIPADHLYVVTFDAYAQAVAAQAPELDPAHIIAEPSGRGTAASIGLAATLIAARDPHAVMGSFHADHAIADAPGFRAALRFAEQVARQGALVTLGITPTYAETGYGYIRYGAPLAHAAEREAEPDTETGRASLSAYAVEQFVEKPRRDVAEGYLAAGNYVWNSGIFVWRVDRILAELRAHVPAVSGVLDEIGAAARQSGGRMTPEVVAVMRAAWPRLRENVTIDVGVMERAREIAVIPIAVGWNDIGSWSQVATLYPPDEAGNVVIGLERATPSAPGGGCLQTATRDTLIYSTTGRRISTAGVEGLVIVDTPDGLLICAKEQAQRVKELAELDQLRRARE
jgi:mannose-1-phosphate guanylyltransferase